MKLDMETKNEEWVEVFKGLIPVDNYRLKVLLTNLSDGQEIRLIGERNRTVLNYHVFVMMKHDSLAGNCIYLQFWIKRCLKNLKKIISKMSFTKSRIVN